MDRLSLWQFAAAVRGWSRAKGGGKAPVMSDARFDALLRAYEGKVGHG